MARTEWLFSFAMDAQERREAMLGMVADWQCSGKSKKRYCHENDIAYSKFHYWSSRSKEVPFGPGRFIPSEGPSGKDGIEVIYPNGGRLKVENF